MAAAHSVREHALAMPGMPGEDLPRGALDPGFGTPRWSDLWRTRERWLALLPLVAEAAGEPGGAEPWRRAVLTRGTALVAALGGASLTAARDTAASLAGLGEGSTPSGDDYLMGVLHGVWAADLPARRWAVELAVACAGRTTGKSARWLAAAARGEAGERWGGLLTALGDGDGAAVREATRRLRALGHTSGSFSLRGFLDALVQLPEGAGGPKYSGIDGFSSR